MANQESIRKWYTALKDGSYKQSGGRLKSDKGYCCWGVACDLSGLGEWVCDNIDGIGYEIPSAQEVILYALPSMEIAEWLGIHSSLETGELPDEITSREDWPSKLSKHAHHSLHGLNDAGASFDLIADVIWHFHGEGKRPEVSSE